MTTMSADVDGQRQPKAVRADWTHIYKAPIGIEDEIDTSTDAKLEEAKVLASAFGCSHDHAAVSCQLNNEGYSTSIARRARRPNGCDRPDGLPEYGRTARTSEALQPLHSTVHPVLTIAGATHIRPPPHPQGVLVRPLPARRQLLLSRGAVGARDRPVQAIPHLLRVRVP